MKQRKMAIGRNRRRVDRGGRALGLAEPDRQQTRRIQMKNALIFKPRA
jgi:hypothetical protein